jgi:Mrp family chromosome partitioning ATPase
MGALIRSAREQYEFIILDSAPMLGLADSRVLAPLVNGVLLVVKNALVPRKHVKQTLSGIRSVGANVIGVALNGVDLHTSGYFDYYADGCAGSRRSGADLLEVDSQGTLQRRP